MLAQAPIIAFVTVSSAHHALHFYRDTLGLQMVEETPYAIVFDCSGVMLRVAINPPPEGGALEPAGYTVLGWQVADIASTIGSMLAKGIKFQQYGFIPQDELGVWTTPGGDRIAWFADPDGNILSLTQFAG
jgi:catechol 2,3-dioxygenase-like lactoylglutathione lyase family enzyme